MQYVGERKWSPKSCLKQRPHRILDWNLNYCSIFLLKGYRCVGVIKANTAIYNNSCVKLNSYRNKILRWARKALQPSDLTHCYLLNDFGHGNQLWFEKCGTQSFPFFWIRGFVSFLEQDTARYDMHKLLSLRPELAVVLVLVYVDIVEEICWIYWQDKECWGDDSCDRWKRIQTECLFLEAWPVQSCWA